MFKKLIDRMIPCEKHLQNAIAIHQEATESLVDELKKRADFSLNLDQKKSPRTPIKLEKTS